MLSIGKNDISSIYRKLKTSLWDIFMYMKIVTFFNEFFLSTVTLYGCIVYTCVCIHGWKPISLLLVTHDKSRIGFYCIIQILEIWFGKKLIFEKWNQWMYSYNYALE